MDATPASQARFTNQDPVHALRNEYYGQNGGQDSGRGQAKGVVVFSYAPEEVLRQAKLEAMEIKIRRKMLEQKAALGDPHALRELHEGPAVDIAKLAELGGGGKQAGGRDQVKALVVPPELTEHGEEIRGSSKVIIKGEKRDFLRLGGAGGGGGGGLGGADGGDAHGSRGGGGAGGNIAAGGRPTPVFRTSDVGERLDAAASARKKQGGSPTRGVGGRRKERRPADPLKKQLRDGMLTYVPAKFEKPEGVARSALVTQAQALSEARHEYDAVKPRRPASAPMRRYMSMGAATGASSSMRAIAAAAALAEAGDASGAGGKGSGGGGGGLAMGDDKWSDVPLVRVQETDLLATYRAKSQRLAAAALAAAAAEAAAARQAAPPPPPGSPRPMRAIIRSDSFSRGQEAGSAGGAVADAATAAAAASVGAGVAGVVGARSSPAGAAVGGKDGAGRATSPSRRGTRSGSVPATAAEAAAAGDGTTPNRRGHTVTVIEPHEAEPTTPRGSKARGAAAGAATAVRSPYAASAARNAAAQAAHAHAHEQAAASSPGLPPKAPPRRSADSVPSIGLNATAAATAAMSARVHKSSRPASAIAAASNSSAWAAAPAAGSGAGAGGATRVWSASGPSSSPPRVGAMRRPASASAASGGGAAAGAGKSLLSAPGGGATESYGMPRQTYQPPDPESRRAIQSRPGSAVGTAKTNNRIRGPARGGSSSLAATYSGPASAGAAGQPWAEGSFSGGGLDAHGVTSRSLSGSSLLASASLPLPHPLPQPGDPWATPSTSFPDAADRAHLQERILGGLARQYAMSAEETAEALAAAGHGAHAVAAAAAAGGGGGAGRRGAGGAHVGMTAEEAAAMAAVQRTAAMAVAAGDGGGGGGGGRVRPQSAPNRRLRPPSAGHWAGRPDPESVRRSLIKSGATHVYDPEVQPTPVDNYMNSLVGLD